MSAIPYTVDRRPDTGLNNVQLGMWLFLASEAMLFGGLFSAYFMLRAGSVEPWPPLREHLGPAAFNTLLLLGGSAALLLARRAGTSGRTRAFRGWMSAAVLLPLLFLPHKTREYLHLLDMGFSPATSTQWATYYLLTGVHAVHVAGGVLANASLAIAGAARWKKSPARELNRLAAVSLYWYFVDFVWLVLVVLLYVV